MLLDLIQPNNLNTYNISLAHTIGLSSAIYCSELLNILGQVTKKNKFDEDGYFKLDRNYMFKRTTLSIEDQLNVDNSLSKINLIQKKDQDIIRLDVKLLCDIMANDDVNISKDLNQRTIVKGSKEAKESRKDLIRNRLKEGIVCSNAELLTALRGWVDAMYESGKGMNKATVKTFQDTMNNYTQGDLDLALRLVQIATTNCYRDCSWAINIYEKDLKNRNRMISNNTVMNRVKKENMSSEGELIDVFY